METARELLPLSNSLTLQGEDGNIPEMTVTTLDRARLVGGAGRPSESDRSARTRMCLGETSTDVTTQEKL
jgi:hypothetical protein